MAALSVANIIKSSLGPVGLDKMLVDDVGVSSLRCVVMVSAASILAGRNSNERWRHDSEVVGGGTSSCQGVGGTSRATRPRSWRWN